MATKYLQLGSLPNAIIYDDTIFPEGIKTDGDIEAANIKVTGGISNVAFHVSEIQAGGAGALGFRYRGQQLTFVNGILTGTSGLSAWVNV